MRISNPFKSRGTLVIAFVGALLAIAVVLQAAESMFSSNEEYAPPPPVTDREAIRDFIDTARPKLLVEIEERRMRVGNAPGSPYIHFDAEKEDMEALFVCLKEGHNRVMDRLVEETTEIPGGTFARARFREEIQGEFKGVFSECLQETLDIPAIPSFPELSADQELHD